MDNKLELDELHQEAKRHVLETRIASTSNLQSYFQIGYARADHILNCLEQEGIVKRNKDNRRIVVGQEENNINCIIDSLVEYSNSSSDETNTVEATNYSQTINEMLKKAGVNAEVISFDVGRTATRYNVLLQDGEKAKSLYKIEDELIKRYTSVRIEEYGINKPTASIEVLNLKRGGVSFKECINEIKDKDDKLIVPLGIDLNNRLIAESLRDLVHIVIGGTTGAGKSILIDDMMMSLVMRNTSEEVNFALIDPKCIEFTRFRKLPHVKYPIANTKEETIELLDKINKEMEERFYILANKYCNNISDYNQISENKLPVIVVIIDEYADILGDDKDEVETLVRRLLQKGRAAGIHVILSTQRPSPNVISRSLLCNFPTKICMSVASSVDSRTIIGCNDGEVLKGGGDILVDIPKHSSLVRMQTPNITGKEIAKICEEISK